MSKENELEKRIEILEKEISNIKEDIKRRNAYIITRLSCSVWRSYWNENAQCYSRSFSDATFFSEEEKKLYTRKLGYDSEWKKINSFLDFQ
jgi:hypothetical protein